MNRAERRRQESEARKSLKKGSYRHYDDNPGEEEPDFRRLGASPGLLDYGMPHEVTREWVVANSDESEGMGVVVVPESKRDGLMTHARYVPKHTCELDEDDCDCNVTAVMWELMGYES